jgi:hypothetical protein
MIRKIYIPPKEIQVIDLRNLCKRKKQLESIDVTLCPDATAIVQDQDGNELARENIASGASKIIPVNVGGGINEVSLLFDSVFVETFQIDENSNINITFDYQ